MCYNLLHLFCQLLLLLHLLLLLMFLLHFPAFQVAGIQSKLSTFVSFLTAWFSFWISSVKSWSFGPSLSRSSLDFGYSVENDEKSHYDGKMVHI